MKCHIFFLLCLCSLFSNVYSLGLDIISLVGNTAVVQWTREEFDPDPLGFDLRFVMPPYFDVGLAQANIDPNEFEFSGNITVDFPLPGPCMLVAVTGSQDDFEIGRSAVVEIPGPNSTMPTSTSTTVPTSTTTIFPTRSQTPTPASMTPSPSKSLSTMECSAGLKKKPNVSAIVLGVLGGVVLMAILIFAVFYFRRRSPMKVNRISFYRERMVQQRSSDEQNPSVGRVGGQGGVLIPYAFSGLRASLGSTRQSSRETRPLDIEQGLAVPPPEMTSLPPNSSVSRPNTPIATSYIVPPPLGPRDRAKSVRRIESSGVAPLTREPTSRQRQLADKLADVEKQIEEIKSQPKPLPSTIVLLDNLKLQKAWLVRQQDSMWALEEIDTVPPGFSRYMES